MNNNRPINHRPHRLTITRTRWMLLLPLLALIATSCYYDNEQDLYPQSSSCDTAQVTYTNSILPIISAQCTSCHTGIGAGGNVRLDSYSTIAAAAANGSLLGTIRHESGWSPMPKGGNQLDDCSIIKVEIWVADGTPNN